MSEKTSITDSIGYIVEIAPGGPWLAQDGSIAVEWSERGIWPTTKAAQEAMDASTTERVLT